MACTLPPDLNAGTLNVGGSLRDRITDIAYIFTATNMDYLSLQDTRQTKREGQSIAATIRELLPPGTLRPCPHWRSTRHSQQTLEPPRQPLVC